MKRDLCVDELYFHRRLSASVCVLVLRGGREQILSRRCDNIHFQPGDSYIIHSERSRGQLHLPSQGRSCRSYLSAGLMVIYSEIYLHAFFMVPLWSTKIILRKSEFLSGSFAQSTLSEAPRNRSGNSNERKSVCGKVFLQLIFQY